MLDASRQTEPRVGACVTVSPRPHEGVVVPRGPRIRFSSARAMRGHTSCVMSTGLVAGGAVINIRFSHCHPRLLCASPGQHPPAMGVARVGEQKQESAKMWPKVLGPQRLILQAHSRSEQAPAARCGASIQGGHGYHQLHGEHYFGQQMPARTGAKRASPPVTSWLRSIGTRSGGGSEWSATPRREHAAGSQVPSRRRPAQNHPGRARS